MTLKVSPTSLTTFDVDTAFGCKRRWWFKYVMKFPEPTSDGAILGDKLHKAIEANELNPILAPAKPYIDEVHAGGWHLEVQVDDDKLLPGLKFTGRIDALNPEKRIIRDWKTMKTLQYAKPSMMLERDMQMQLYAAAVADTGEEIIVEHINIATTLPHQVLRTFAVSTPEKRAVVLEKALALADGMLQYTSISDVNETEPDRSKCRLCAFKPRCPTGEKTVNLLNAILGTPAPKPAEPAEAPLAPAAFAGERESDRAATAVLNALPKGILPPEALKAEAVPAPIPTPPMPTQKRKLPIIEVPSEPAPTPTPAPPPDTSAPAEVKPAPAPVEQSKRGRGRPPGAKNKPKDTLPAGATGAEGIQHIIDSARREFSGSSLEVTSITVTRGATVQVVQFEPMRIEVSATADVVGMSVAEAVQALDSQVLAEVIRRMQEMQAAKVGGK